VLSDVDLRLTATPTGLSEVLVVKNAAAAANPDLDGLTFGVNDGDLTASSVPGGTTLAKDVSGTTQVAAPAPTWWDSSSAGASAAGPGSLGVPAPVPATSTDTQFSIDAGTVAQTPGVTYPVYVDPDYKTGGVINWAFIDSAYPNQAYWHDSGASDGYQHVGYVDGGHSDDGRDHTTSSFWQMDTSFLNGRVIQNAVFNTTEVYSYSCSARSVQLWTTSPISPSSTAANPPIPSSLVDTESVAYGYNSTCPGHVVGFPTTDAVQRAADNSYDNINLGLYASTSDVYGWKKFDSSASLVVWFDTKPTQPSYRWVFGCAFVCGSGAYTNDDTPILTGASQDADGDALSYNFEVYSGHSAAPTNRVAYGATAYLTQGLPSTPDGARGRWAPSSALPDGDYEYHVRAYDGVAYSDWSSYLPFTVVHTRRPSLPTISVPANGPVSTSPNSFYGAVGSARETVTVVPAASSDDPVYAYSYGMFPGNGVSFGSYGDCSTPNVGAYSFRCGGLGSGVPITITPIDNMSTLGIAVWDAAGNEATVTDANGNPVAGYASQTFWASDDRSTTRVGHQWLTSSYTGSMACTAASTLADLPAPDTTASDMTVAAGHACWTTSAVHPDPVPVLRFDGSAASVSTGAAPKLIDTSGSFTAGAWVNVSSGAPNAETFLDQEGTNESVFFLQFVKDAQGLGHFSFCMSNSDATSYDGNCVTRSETPLANTWYFVAGEWDATNHQMRLYVSDTTGTTNTPAVGYHSSSWNATVKARVGADRIGSTQRYFKGMVCDPFIDSGVLDGNQLGFTASYGLQSAVS